MSKQNKHILAEEDLEKLIGRFGEERAKDEFAQAVEIGKRERLEGVWLLSGALAQEVGTPLNRLNLHASALLQGVDNNHPMRKHLEGLYASLVELKEIYHKSQSVVRYCTVKGKDGRPILDLENATDVA